MPSHLPPMSPIRCFTGGVPVAPPSPVRVSAAEVAARHAPAPQAEQEAALLAECYRRGSAGIESQVAHQQNQQLITELLHRQAFRAESGHQLLTPLRTTVALAEPTPREPEPTPVSSPMTLVVDGQVLDTAPELERPGAGLVQRQQEARYRAMNLAEAAALTYTDAVGKTMFYTPEDRKRQQATEDAYAAREKWRTDQGQDYVPSDLEWLRGQMEPTPARTTEAPSPEAPVAPAEA